MQFWEKKMNCHEMLIYFLLFSSFSFKTWKLRKKNWKIIFLVISTHFHVLSENERKNKKYINFSWQIIFFSQNCINYPFSSFSWRINILSKKDHLYFISEKRNMCHFTKKKNGFHRKSKFYEDYLLISLFSSKKRKILNIATIYYFSEKIINDVYFNFFWSINGILNKTLFYKYNIYNLSKEENSA